MNHARGGFWADWEIGREPGKVTVYSDRGWPTEFTCFRFAIPEAAGFRSRAIYLDVDMIALGDLRELFEQDMLKPWLVTPTCPAAMLIDCAYFETQEWWPRINDMKRSGWAMPEYGKTLIRHDAVGGYFEALELPRWHGIRGRRNPCNSLYAPGNSTVAAVPGNL